MLDLVAPAGTPVPFSFLLKSLFPLPDSKERGDSFIDKIQQEYSIEYCYLLSTGRGALYFILQAAKQLADPEKREVIIPAYTCFSVPSAIVKAGLRIRLVDIDPRTLDYNYSQLEGVDSKDGLAVMACNLFGILSDMHKLERIAGENQLYLIDDAAQSMGSRHGSKYSGTFGDAGIFSLGRGKNMTAYEGGVLVTNNDRIAGKIDDSITELAKPSIKAEIKAFSNLLFYSLFLRPRLYWIPARIPFLHLGETVFDPDFKLSQLSGIQKSVSALMFNELSGINSIRKKNALAIGQALIDNGSYMIPGYTESNCPAYIRLPVICPNNSWRDRAIQKLVSRGINATIMYPCGIHQIPGIREHLGPDCGHFPGAEMVADRLLTIPTHPYLKQTHIETIISTLAEMK